MSGALVACEVLSALSSSYLYMITVMLVPYTVYYLVGMNFNRFSKTMVQSLGVLSLVGYLIMAIHFYYSIGRYVLTGAQKYPPRFYYTSYALGIGLLLILYRERVVNLLNKLKLLKFTLFVGANTFWIYLWHIPLVDYIAGKYHPLTCFAIVYTFSIAMVYIQKKIVDHACLHTSKGVEKYIRMIFQG